jgi:hypothetical protein
VKLKYRKALLKLLIITLVIQTITGGKTSGTRNLRNNKVASILTNSARVSPKSYIASNNNSVPSISTNQTRVSPKSPNLNIKRVKFCSTCNLDTHYDTYSYKCPFNPNFVGVQNKVCNSCQQVGHCNKRYHLCPHNSKNQRLNDILNQEESHPRKCFDCQGEDHINIRSNLCSKNPNRLGLFKF